jgi:hypothetical protein
MSRILRPDWMMIATWTVMVGLFYAIPIRYENAPDLLTWTTIAIGIAAFCAGALLAGRFQIGSGEDSPAALHLDRIIIACAIAGIFGALAIAVDKFVLSGVDLSKGLTVLREQRADDVVAGVPIRRSILLYAGYLTISFSCVAIALFLLEGERVGKIAGWLGQISIVSMVMYAGVYGGRMPALLVLLLAIGAALTRKVQGKSLLPKGWWLWPKLGVTAILLLIYTNFIFADRRQMNGIESFDQFLVAADVKWELTPSQWLVEGVREGSISPEPAMDFLSSAMYLTHSPTTVRRMLDHAGRISIYRGLYQVGVLSPLFDVLAPSLGLPAKMRTELAATGVYGWFPSAWGALLADAGRWGAPIFAFAWGLFAGLSYRCVKLGGRPSSGLLLTFTYMTVLISPLNGPFGMANSFLIFGSFVVVSSFLQLQSWMGREVPKVSGS